MTGFAVALIFALRDSPLDGVPLGLIFGLVVVVIAFIAAVDVLLAAARSRSLRRASWDEEALENDEIAAWHRSVVAMARSGAPPQEGEEHDYFYHVVGYRFARARTVASSLMIVGLLGTFIGMGIALSKSSDAMVALQQQLGESSASAEAVAAEGRTDIEELRDELNREMQSATGALGSYVSEQRLAVQGMAVGVTSSIAGIFFALLLFVLIGLSSRSFDALLEQARRSRHIWVANVEGGIASVARSIESMPRLVAAEVRSALNGVGEIVGASVGTAIKPVSSIIETFGGHVEAQSETLKTWAEAQEKLTAAANEAFTKLSSAAELNRQVSETNRENFNRIARAMDSNTHEMEEFRIGFDELIANVEGLGKSYAQAGNDFAVVVNALQDIEQHHGYLNQNIDALNTTVHSLGLGLSSYNEEAQRILDAGLRTASETVGGATTQLAAKVEAYAKSTVEHNQAMQQEVRKAIHGIARESTATAEAIAKRVYPEMARAIAREVDRLVVRSPWYERMLPFLKSNSDEGGSAADPNVRVLRRRDESESTTVHRIEPPAADLRSRRDDDGRSGPSS